MSAVERYVEIVALCCIVSVSYGRSNGERRLTGKSLDVVDVYAIAWRSMVGGSFCGV